MKILVTGAAGAIGSHIAERLLSLGHEVVCIDALTNYYSPDIKKINANDVREKGGTFHYIDLAKDDLNAVSQGVEIVYHLAAQPGISATTPFEDYLNNNIVATQRLLEAVRGSSHLKAFIHISTSSIYGARANGDETVEPKPTSNYGVTKLAAEQLAMSYYRDKELPVTVLRFFSVYGERERPEKFFHKLIKAMYEDVEVPLFEGSDRHVRSFTYVGDIVDGCILTLDNLAVATGEIFNIGTDITATTGEGIQIIERIMEKKAMFKMLPPRSGDQFETAANIIKARKLIGHNPKTDLETGLRAEIDWYASRIRGNIA